MSLTLTTREAELLADAFPENSIATVEDITSGLNSNVKKIIFTNSEKVVLKEYREDPNRDRLLSEQLALNYIKSFAKNKSADWLFANPQKRLAILSFIEGQPNPKIQKNELRYFTEFQINLDRHKNKLAAASLIDAADACFCAKDLISQIQKRITIITAKASHLDNVAKLLNTVIIPRFTSICDLVEKNLLDLGIPLDKQIPKSWRTIIASDFGSHNSIKVFSGELVFIDFEYFGWDDPITGIANFATHPNMNASEAIKKDYEALMLDYFRFIPYMTQRYFSLKPLFIIRWALIMLNTLAQSDTRGFLRQTLSQELRSYQQSQVEKAAAYLRNK